jgi:FkbM family methyltransferase
LGAYGETKKVIRGTFRSLGLEVARWNPQSSPEAALIRMLSIHSIDTVIDVGANEGQYALTLRRLGFDGRIVSFEPSTAAHNRLRHSAKADERWTVGARTALGNREGTVDLTITSNGGASSSVLPMMDVHKSAAPDVACIGSERVPMMRLDQAAEGLLPEARNIFLKLDVQGYELEVLEGAPKLIERIHGVQLELSLVPLYQGQTLFPELMDFVQERGFGVWGIIPGLVDKASGRLLQTDVIFFREQRTEDES